MPKPLFRQQITERMERLPAPIRQLWRLVDGLHHTASAGITGIQTAHMGVRDHVVLPTAARFGVPDRMIHGFRARHTRFFDRVYEGLRTVHWYV
ncbi:hypothetical protein [Nocardia heshunensis]